MQEILEAIRAVRPATTSQPADPRVLPRRLRAPRGAGHVRGGRVRGQGPAQVAARRGRPDARAGARTRSYVAVMASAINFNTVWTSIFEPLPDVRLPRPARQGEPSGAPATPSRLPRRRLRRVGRRAAGRLGGAQLEAGRPGHRPLQPRRRPGPVGPRRLDARRPTSASGASRRTSAAWPTSPWSRPTS